MLQSLECKSRGASEGIFASIVVAWINVQSQEARPAALRCVSNLEETRLFVVSVVAMYTNPNPNASIHNLYKPLQRESDRARSIS
jgi:hypothetical protein